MLSRDSSSGSSFAEGGGGNQQLDRQGETVSLAAVKVSTFKLTMPPRLKGCVGGTGGDVLSREETPALRLLLPKEEED